MGNIKLYPLYSLTLIIWLFKHLGAYPYTGDLLRLESVGGIEEDPVECLRAVVTPLVWNNWE